MTIINVNKDCSLWAATAQTIMFDFCISNYSLWIYLYCIYTFARGKHSALQFKWLYFE